jgi:hypothetical protein
MKSTTSAPSRIPVRISHGARSKAMQLERYAAYQRATRVWGKDEKLLRSNLLQVNGSTTYTVLLAFRRG